MKLATRDAIREIDRRAIDELGIAGLILMENAGRSAAAVICSEFPGAKSAAVFAGGGNNAGDGFVVARHLLSRGLSVVTYLASPPERLTGDALTNFLALRNSGGDVRLLEGGFGCYTPADVVVDALFGTGLTRPVEGFYREVIEFVNSLPAPRVALDLPSGLDADTGHPLGACVRAQVTVTFILPKLGLAVYPGAEYAGKVYVAPLTTPPFLEVEIPYEVADFETLRAFLHPRRQDTHKGTYGHLLVLAGSPGKTGAATLSALGALRVGTGLVTVGVPASLNPIFETNLIEAMTEPLPETPRHTLGREALEPALAVLSDRKTALVIGPGISTGEDTASFVREVLLEARVPVVVDADALTCLAQDLGVLLRMKAPCVLTPHPGEMSRLSGVATAEIQSNRPRVARDFAAKYNVYLVLKGARTVVASPDGKVFINPTGNAGMASGGMGDVLSGAVGGFLAQRIPPMQAALLGVFLHGLAGDLARREAGEAGMIATDVAARLPLAIDELLYGQEVEFFPIVR
jgi:NAD(P)H-hydrate epimerase